MSRLIMHDPFGRFELRRESITVGASNLECDFCGAPPRRGHSLFRYFTVPDDSLRSRRAEIRGLFCSVGCMRAYHS